MKRIALWAAIVFAVVIGVLALIPFAVDLNQHRGTLLNLIRPYVNREVDFSQIRLTLLSGIGVEIQDLRVLDDPAFARDTFFTAEGVQLKVALLPLLKKQVRITKIILKTPAVHVVRSADGRYNFQGILKPRPEKAKPKPAVLINHVQIKNGRVSYRNLKGTPGKAPLLIDAIDLKAREVSLFRPISFDLAAAVMHPEGQNLSLTGTFGPLNLSGGVRSSPVSVHARLEDMPAAILPAFTAGAAGFTLDARGSMADTITISTTLDLQGLRFQGPATPAALSGKVAAEMALAWPQETLRITSGTCMLGEDRVSFTGGVEHLRAQPQWNVIIQSARFNPGPLIAAIPQLARRIPAKLALQGPARLKMTTSGTPQSFQVTSSADLGAMTIRYGTFFSKPAGTPLSLTANTVHQTGLIEIPSITVGLDRIAATGKGLIVKGRTAFAFQTNPMTIEGAARYLPVISRFKPTGVLQLAGDMQGERGATTLKLQAASQTLSLHMPQSPSAGAKPPLRADLQDMLLVIDARKTAALAAAGTFRSRRGSLMNIPFQNLNGALAYGGNRLSIRPFAFDVFKGSIRGSAAYDLKAKQWQVAPEIARVQAGNVFDAFATSKGVFSGTLSGKAAARGGSGVQTLHAEADMQIAQGEWRNFDLSHSVLGSLLAIPGFAQMAGLDPQTVQDYKTTRFDRLTTRLKIGGGVLTIDAMQMSNIRTGGEADANARLHGSLDLASRSLNLKGTIALPRKMSQRWTHKAHGLQSLQDETQRIALPLTIRGTLQKPAPSVDTRTVKQALVGYATGQAVEKGMQKLREKTGLPVDKETGKEVEQLIKGLFK